MAEAQLLRTAGLNRDRADSISAFELLELLGRRWYGLATRMAPARSGSVEVLAAIAEQFTDARRILNAVTDTYLFPLRERWFGRPAA